MLLTPIGDQEKLSGNTPQTMNWPISHCSLEMLRYHDQSLVSDNTVEEGSPIVSVVVPFSRSM